MTSDYISFYKSKSKIDCGEISVSSLVSFFLNNINKNKEYNAFIEVFENEAKSKAKEIDKKIKEKKAGRLAGMIIAIKDNICYKNHKVSAASKILENFESIYNATVIERLLKEDAIIIGRLNCDEFAMGSANEYSYYGKALNPVNKEYVPGGSSGGAAIAVKLNMCHLSLGSDTGGSIRQPASFCGVIGLKPSYGRVSRYGLIAYASSFDQIGPIANSIEDIAIVLEVIAGKDKYDSTLSSKKVEPYLDFLKNYNKDIKFKIAFYKNFLENNLIDNEIKKYTYKILNLLKKDGHKVKALDFDLQEYLIPTYYILTTAEASSNLARYDGIHFGYQSKNAYDLESTYLLSRSEGFGTEVKRRIMLGTFVLSAGYYDAYYTKAQKVRRIIQNKTLETFKNFDFIITPTTPHTAFKIGIQTNNPVKMYLEDIFTVQSNLAGIPSISLPLGKHSNGLPFGIQIMANMFKEKELLLFSKQLLTLNS